NYTSAGGRAFVTHYQWVWVGPPVTLFPQTANWTTTTAGNGTTAVNETKYFGTNNGVDFDYPVTAFANTSFPKGADFAKWLVFAGAAAATDAGPVSIPIDHAVHTMDSVVIGDAAANPIAQGWLTSPSASRPYRPGNATRQNPNPPPQNNTQQFI